MKAEMSKHLALTTQEAVARLQGNWAATSPPTTRSTTTSSTCPTCSRTGSSSSSRSGSAPPASDVDRTAEQRWRLNSSPGGGTGWRRPDSRCRWRRGWQETRATTSTRCSSSSSEAALPSSRVRITAPLDEGHAA